MTPEYAEIAARLDAMHAAVTAERAARTRATSEVIRAAKRELDTARTAVRARFVAEHGWLYTEQPFTIDQLRRGSTQRKRDDYAFRVSPMDHVEYFRLAGRPWHPVAILSHEYGPIESSYFLAEKYGLTATLLPTSWYSPERANAVLYMGYYSPCL